MYILFAVDKTEADDKTLSHRQKQRLVKRVQKQDEKKIKLSGHQRVQNQKKVQQKQKKYHSESEEDENDSSSVEGESGDQVIKGFSDDNKKWLTPKIQTDPDDDEEEGSDSSGDENGVATDDSDEDLDEEEVILVYFSPIQLSLYIIHNNYYIYNVIGIVVREKIGIGFGKKKRFLF